MVRTMVPLDRALTFTRRNLLNKLLIVELLCFYGRSLVRPLCDVLIPR